MKKTQSREYESIARIFKLMANAKRLQILDSVKDKEVTVNELSKILGVRKSNTSQHLAFLRYTGLVTARRSGKNVFYKISNPKIIDSFDVIRKLSK